MYVLDIQTDHILIHAEFKDNIFDTCIKSKDKEEHTCLALTPCQLHDMLNCVSAGFSYQALTNILKH